MRWLHGTGWWASLTPVVAPPWVSLTQPTAASLSPSHDAFRAVARCPGRERRARSGGSQLFARSRCNRPVHIYSSTRTYLEPLAHARGVDRLHPTGVTAADPVVTGVGIGPGGMPVSATGMAGSLFPWMRSASPPMIDPTSSAGMTDPRTIPSPITSPASPPGPAVPACIPAPSWRSRSTRGR